jgi:hypothetical protein
VSAADDGLKTSKHHAREVVARAIYDAQDEVTRKLLVRPDLPGASELEGSGKPVCYHLADAILAALKPIIAAEIRALADAGQLLLFPTMPPETIASRICGDQ